MGKIQHAMVKLDFTVPAGTTVYVPLGMGPLFSHATEVQSEIPWRTAVTMSKLWVRVITNGTSGSSTVRVRKNGDNGNQLVTIDAGATGEFEDTSNTDAFGVGDKACLQITAGAGGALDISVITIVVDTGGASSVVKYVSGVGSFSTASTTRTFSLCNTTGVQTTANEAEDQYQFEIAGDLKNHYAYVSSNGRTTNTSTRLRKNGADTSGGCLYNSGVTGAVEDTSTTISVAAGDLMCNRLTTSTGSNPIVFDTVAIEFITTTAQSQCIARAPIGGSTVNAGETRYSSLMGRAGLTTSEANARMEVKHNFTLSNFKFNVQAVTQSGNTTIRVRKNGVNTSIVVVVPTGAAVGWKEDSTNTATFAPGDELSVSIVCDSGTGGTMIESIGGTIEGTTPGGSSPVLLFQLLLG